MVVLALWGLGRTAVKSVWLAVVAALSAGAVLAGAHELAVLAAAAAACGAARLGARPGGLAATGAASVATASAAAATVVTRATTAPFGLWPLFLLDGVNVASLALMAVVSWQLGHAALVDTLTVALGAAAALALLRYRVNSAWLVAAGAAVRAAAQALA